MFGPQQGECFWSVRKEELVVKEATKVIANRFSNGGVFLGVGLTATHLPLVAPQQFFDLYPISQLKSPPGFWPGAENPLQNIEDIADLPERAKEMVVKKHLAQQLVEDNQYWQFVQAYLATISFADHLVGVLLDSLIHAGVLDNTYIVLWSDHGMSMGEKQSFKKFTLWERSLRVPFMISGPGIRAQKIKSPVSLIDIYPTLCALMNIEIPSWCNGNNMSRSLLTGASIKNPRAISIYGRGADSKPKDEILSVKVHTEEWNYIRHGPSSAELYSRKEDPHEWHNLFNSESQYSETSKLVKYLDGLIPSQGELALPVWA